MAAAGSARDDFWTAVPMTRPAVATYLTGLAPDRHGVRDNLFAPLGEGVPTLATELTSAGYRTAAFPDSRFLGAQSGLLGGFEIASEPPAPLVYPARWLPDPRTPEEVSTDLVAWLDSLPEGERYFAWLHFSWPLLRQLREKGNERLIAEHVAAKRAERSRRKPGEIEKFDAALGQIVEAIEARGEIAESLFVVVGTQGDPGGGDDEIPGSGFSLHERALRVPLIMRLPATVGKAATVSSSEEPIWAPDVAATIADAAGVELSADSEGVSLLGDLPEGRVVFAWSWATLDQMGLPALRAARSRYALRVEGLGDLDLVIDGAGESVESGGPGEVEERETDRLAAALDGRAEPSATTVPLERVRPFLEARGLHLRPVPADGRSPGDAATRRESGHELLAGRVGMRQSLRRRSEERFRAALEADPNNLAARVDLGMMQAFTGKPDALDILVPAVERYPTRPEVLHWYAHAVWQQSWEEAEELLELILPFKPIESDLLYDMACARSLAGDLTASESYLRRAIDAGFRDWSHMESDPDLRNLRASGKFSVVLQEYRK
jgi:tetratricopeptide (TPR) repeat protein